MVRITEELLSYRRRSEHNEGILYTLKEITLHQFEIEKIELLDKFCRQLEIIYLQNNLISKIENLHKLKRLKYLNLAINNITRVENLEGCESLEKLDLTVNFMDELLSLESLKGNYNLKELYLVANPCTEFHGYRHFVIATLPQLRRLDGQDIEPEERERAKELHAKLREELVELSKQPKDKNIEDHREARIASYKELQRKREEAENSGKTDEEVPVKEEKIFREDGTVIQKNEGHWKFTFSEDEEHVVLKVGVPKFLDTSLLEIDLQPKYFIMKCKGKVLRLNLPAGELLIQMKRVTPNEALRVDDQLQKKENVVNRNVKKEKTAVDIRNIVKDSSSRMQHNDDTNPEDIEDLPPLEDI